MDAIAEHGKQELWIKKLIKRKKLNR
jgi:hypothetical protein